MSRKNSRPGKLIAAVAAITLSTGALSPEIVQAKEPVVTAVAGKPTLLLGAYDVATLGYAEEEFFVAGDATSYHSPIPLKSDGHWTVEPAGTAAYKTRVVVLRPLDSAKFNGTVIVEWLNVSGGLDAPADWLMAHREFLRAGYAYVAVSAQKVGIDGGASMGMDMSLKKMTPARYASLVHPGDAYAYDIFSQAGRLVRATGPSAIMPMLKPLHVLAAGESQSAHFMTTYVNAIDPLAKVYDGYLIHSRFAGSAPLDGTSIMGGAPTTMPEVVKFRTDLRVPVLTVITETDLIGLARAGYYGASQPDDKHLRIWEIPGTAHADTYILGVAAIDTGHAPVSALVAGFAPTTNLMGHTLDAPINFAPQHHYVVEAAFHALDAWVRSGKPAPVAPRITLTKADPPALVTDANGLATGGIRTPWIDVPIALTTGVVHTTNPMARLFGTGHLFDAATLARLYPGGKAEYLQHFATSTDSAIAAGFILPADREEILAIAAAQYP